MAATCAYCLSPITNGENFSLAGTEVFHRACVAEHGIHDSVGNKQRRQLSSFELRHTQTQATVTRLHNQAAQAEHRVSQRDLTIERLRTELDDANVARTLMAEQLSDAKAELARVIAERDKARQDLALAQLPPVQPRVDPTLQGMDDAEIRFSLLDLDK